jgi:REP element-mobilizing transposase RayT
VIFHEHPEVKKHLWGGEFWEDGYFARTVGDKVTAEVSENIFSITVIKKRLQSS